MRPALDAETPKKRYYLSEVSLDIPKKDGTGAEVASDALNSGESVTLAVRLQDSRIPENACIRIESALFATEHVVVIRLP